MCRCACCTLSVKLELFWQQRSFMRSVCIMRKPAEYIVLLQQRSTDAKKVILLMKSIQTELAEGQTASSSDFSWKGNRGGGRRRNAWRTQAKLLVKRLTLSKMRFHEPNSTTKAAKDIRFHATANSFRLFLFKSSQEWLLYESLSTPTYTEAYHEVRLLSTKATTTQHREKRQRKKNIMIKTFLLLSSSPLLLLTRLCRRVSVSLRLSLWRMKISRHDTYTTPYYV